MAYFADSYGAARAAFRAAAARLDHGALAVPSGIDADLTIDWAQAAPEGTPRNLVVVTSGIHGPEGYAGSAVQRLLLEYLRDGVVSRAETGYLLVHAVNPYGFKYGRRVSEANVDLNRNFVADPSAFAVRREAYAALAPILNPGEAASCGWKAEASFILAAARVLRKHKLGVVTQAVAEGQYEFPRGLFFGGTAYEPQKTLLDDLIGRVSAPYERVLLLDVHTGYGSKGKLHLLPGAVEDTATRVLMSSVFADHPVEETGDGGTFYAAAGDMAPYFARTLTQRGKVALGMVLEYGTADNQGTWGSVRTLRRMILENQARWYGAADVAAETQIKREFLELFLPPDAAWREAVVAQARTLLRACIERLRAL